MQLFVDPVQDGIELYDETYHFHASQIDEISLFKSNMFTIILNLNGINCQSWRAETIPLAQMTSTKACYKLGLIITRKILNVQYKDNKLFGTVDKCNKLLNEMYSYFNTNFLLFHFVILTLGLHYKESLTYYISS